MLKLSTQNHSSNEDTRKKLKQHIQSLRNIVEFIELHSDRAAEFPDLVKILDRFTSCVGVHSQKYFSHNRLSETLQKSNKR